MLQDWLLCSLPNFLAFHIQKVMWYLTVIFVSVSINVELIKVFPQVLADFSSIVGDGEQNQIMKKVTSDGDTVDVQFEGNVESNHIEIKFQSLFVLACKDFYQHLNDEQQSTFRQIFESMNEAEIHQMLSVL